jgi:hypothetical protein
VAVAQEDAGQGLHLDILQGASLGLGEASHLGLGEAHVGERLSVDPREAALDLGGVEPEAGRIPAVEAVGVLAHGVVAALAHGGHDLGHGILDGGGAHCMRI